MADTMSPADVMALSNRDGNDGFMNSWVWVFFLFFLLAWGGNGMGFGGNGNGLTQAELQAGLYHQTTDNNLRAIMGNQCDLTKEILENRYDNQVAMCQNFATVNANITDLGYRMQQCCCELKSQILQDKYDATLNELNLARIVASNQTQSQYILGQLGNYYINPAVNPYTCYNSCCCN